MEGFREVAYRGNAPDPKGSVDIGNIKQTRPAMGTVSEKIAMLGEPCLTDAEAKKGPNASAIPFTQEKHQLAWEEIFNPYS